MPICARAPTLRRWLALSAQWRREHSRGGGGSDGGTPAGGGRAGAGLHGAAQHVLRHRGDAAAPARKRAAEAGALEAIAIVMQAHSQVAGVQEHGGAALHSICVLGDDDAAAGSQAAGAADAI